MASIDLLARENAELKLRVEQLEKELLFLKSHPVFLQGLKGETLIASLTGGELTAFAAEHDIELGSNVKLEVKFSKLNTPVAGSSTRRWNWSKPLGWKDKGKDYDFLLLVGDKDMRFPTQYKDVSPYVFLLIPLAMVPSICNSGAAIGANVQLTTNLANAKSPTSIAIKSYMIQEEEISSLLASAKAA